MSTLNTLRYWHRLEHFYPYVIQQNKNSYIKRFSINTENDMPNFELEQYDGKFISAYRVYFGNFMVSDAMEAIENELGQEVFLEKCDDISCFSSFSLDKKGVIDKTSFKISSYPWAVNRIKNKKINFDNWEEDFNAFINLHGSYFNDFNTFTFENLFNYRKKITNEMNWSINFNKPWIIIDVVLSEEKITNDEKVDEDSNAEVILKENELLNSFYIKDLERLISSEDSNSKALSCLHKFINHVCTKRIDIENNFTKRIDVMDPNNLPLGNWPSNHGLRFMQQLDINLFLSKNENLSNFSINGPPGTGKTTLLKSLIAGIIVERAINLAELTSPDEAFERNSIGRINYKNNYNLVFKLKEPYNQYGILVTSNNNGAVQNISKELPLLKELPEKYRSNYTYLNKVSDNILGSGNTWAMIAATLGNRRNKSRFIDSFWSLMEDDKYSLRKDLVNINYSVDWKATVQKFKSSLNAVKEEISTLQKPYEAARKYYECLEKYNSLLENKSDLEANISSIQEKLMVKENEFNLSCIQKNSKYEKLKEMESIDRFIKLKIILPKLFKSAAYYLKIRTDLFNLIELKDNQELIIEETSRIIMTRRDELFAVNDSLSNLQVEMTKLKALVDKTKIEKKQLYSFIDYFDSSQYEEVSKSSPFSYGVLNDKRELLFFEALELQEAFIFKSKKMRVNLDAFSKWMRNIPTNEELSKFSKCLLDSFFIAVPVVSSTFASIGTFLKHIGKEEIPYVFIDEAGQGVPQSAAGAIWRSKKIIAVGDPIQIEPIFTIHNRIIDALKKYYQQDDIISNRFSSVQSLADLSNPYIGFRNVANQTQIVGSPLIVHSRCKKTVFKIANEIAYSNKMIFDTPNGNDDDIYEWLDVEGETENGSHFVKEQAEEIWNKVKSDFEIFVPSNETEVPSIYIISPFKTVKNGLVSFMRDKFRSSEMKSFKNLNKDILAKWVNENIGTIHTFQGKEADTVYLCLGVSSYNSKCGAITWASQSPNILNVAITRAKKKLYIVGDKNLWGKEPFYEVALAYTKK